MRWIALLLLSLGRPAYALWGFEVELAFTYVSAMKEPGAPPQIRMRGENGMDFWEDYYKRIILRDGGCNHDTPIHVGYPYTICRTSNAPRQLDLTIDDCSNREITCPNHRELVDGTKFLTDHREPNPLKKYAGYEPPKNKCGFGLIEIVSKPQPNSLEAVQTHLDRIIDVVQKFQAQAGKVIGFPLARREGEFKGLGPLTDGMIMVKIKEDTSLYTSYDNGGFQMSMGIPLSTIHTLANIPGLPDPTMWKTLANFGDFKELSSSVEYVNALPNQPNPPSPSGRLAKNFLVLWHWMLNKRTLVGNPRKAIGRVGEYQYKDPRTVIVRPDLGEILYKNRINPSPRFDFRSLYFALVGFLRTTDKDFLHQRFHPRHDKSGSRLSPDVTFVAPHMFLVGQSGDCLLVFEQRTFYEGNPCFKALKDGLVGSTKESRPPGIKNEQYAACSKFLNVGYTSPGDPLHPFSGTGYAFKESPKANLRSKSSSQGVLEA